jgi:hypothetical protein
MDDNSLENVDGQQGVIAGLEFYFNAQKSATPALDGLGLNGTASNPTGDCSNPDECSVAIQFAGREARTLDNTQLNVNGTTGTGTTPVQGEWLMFKDSYFAVKMPGLFLDGSFMGVSNGVNINAALSSGASYASFADISHFENSAGACLLFDNSGNPCTTANLTSIIDATPALYLHQTGGTTSYDKTTGISSGYNDISLSFQLGGLSVGYDNPSAGACGITGGAGCGYLNANNANTTSFMGLAIHDNNSAFAGIAVGGKMYMYGF